MTVDLDNYKNPGIAYLNAPTGGTGEDLPRTVIVVGVARSGTSMVASSLRQLGVFIGDRADNVVHEDVSIAAALEQGDEKALARIISSRNTVHRLWGFKRPTAFQVIGDYLHLFRAPRFVVTFRDLVAIAKRNELSMEMEFLNALELGRQHANELVAFVAALDVPAMLVSYEKALLDPRGFVRALAGFCGVSADEETFDEAANAIRISPEPYLDASRVKYEGRLDNVVNGIATGWVRRLGQEKPVKVLVMHGGDVVGRGIADHYREDLERAGKSGGKCGFRIPLALPNIAREDISVQVEDSSYVVPTSQLS